MNNPAVVVVVVGIIITVVVLLIAAISIRGQRADVVEERLGRYTEASTFLTTKDEDEEKTKKKEPSALARRMESMLQGKGFAENWKGQLQRADLKLTVSEFLLFHVAAMIGMAAIA